MTDTNLVRFRMAVAGALAHLESRREEVNELNVFPVADGDTGDNMALTLRAVLEELDRLQASDDDRTIDEIGREEIVDSVARAALLGARGNSGVILSQLIRGETDHYWFVCAQTARGVMQVQLDTGVPCAFGVLTCETMEQALARAGGGKRDQGRHAAEAVLAMARLRGEFSSS